MQTNVILLVLLPHEGEERRHQNDLARLQDEHTLQQSHHHADQPVNGGGLAVAQAVEDDEVGAGYVRCRHKEPADYGEPPGEAATGVATLQAVLTLFNHKFSFPDLCRDVPTMGSKNLFQLLEGLVRN